MNDTTTEVKPALYVGTYAKYNSGSISGAWLKLDDCADSEAFLDACKKLHEDEDDPELMFQDFEGFPQELYSESMSASELDKLYGYLSFDEHDREIISEYLDATGCSLADLDYQDAIDSFYYELESRNQEDQQREFGEYVVNEGLFGVEIPDALQNYIDYEALGRDWLMDFSVSDNGFVFSDN